MSKVGSGNSTAKSTSSAPTTSKRPEARPSNSSAPTSSVRPVARPSTAAPETSLRPAARPTPNDRIDTAFDVANEGTSPGLGSLISGLSDSFTPGQGERVAEAAEGWAGRDFKPGETARCADFVSSVVAGSGVDAPDFEHTLRARDFGRMGEAVDPDNLQPGDVVAFNNTYRWSANDQDHTHVGIYVGDGQMVHRPTADEPVERVAIDEYLSRPRSGNLDDRLPPRSLVGGYRLTEEDSPIMLASN